MTQLTGRSRPRTSRIPATASAAVRGVLTGADRELTVAAVFPAAVYLAGAKTGGIELVLVSSDGIAHPNAVVLPAAHRPFAAARVGRMVTIGAHRVATGWGDIEVARWWSPRPPLPQVERAPLRTAARTAARLLADRAAVLAPRESVRFQTLTDALDAGDRFAAQQAATSLLGLGAGLTPTGDDLLAGLFAGVALLGPTVYPAPATSLIMQVTTIGHAVVARGPEATTAISASLLRHAVRGEVCTPAARLLLALARGSRADRLGGALDELLTVGASSGRDLALGLIAAARLVAAARPVDDAPPSSLSSAPVTSSLSTVRRP